MSFKIRPILCCLLCLNFALSACQGEDPPTDSVKGHEVGFVAKGSVGTKTSLDAEHASFRWENGDRISLWARKADGTPVLDNQAFALTAKGFHENEAWFSSTLHSEMPEGTYTYFMTYPQPESVSGNMLYFTLPSVQNGKASDGTGICVSTWNEGPALRDLSDGAGSDAMKAGFSHILHYLRFYIPEGCNTLGEDIKTLVFTMPQAIAGKVSIDMTDGSASLSEGSSTISVNTAEAFGEGVFVAAGIFPPSGTYGAEDAMRITIYSNTKKAELIPVSLEGRDFKAGHITSVPLRPMTANNHFEVRFDLKDNKLGEEVKMVTLTLPQGSVWPDSDSNVKVYSEKDGSDLNVGESFLVETGNESAFRALSGLPLTISYESEHAIVTESVTLPDLGSAGSAAVDMHCPYLFFEDFSSIESFSSGDKHSASNTGNKSPYQFGDGWSVARAGGEQGLAIRLAAHREFFATYDSRCDSAPLRNIKDGASVDVVVTFNYSMNRQEGGLGSAPKLGATLHIGWHDNLEGLSSGNTSGNFVENFHVNETTGSYNDISNVHSTVLPQMTNAKRISWREVPDGTTGTSNGTYWLYLDNVRVHIQ